MMESGGLQNNTQLTGPLVKALVGVHNKLIKKETPKAQQGRIRAQSAPSQLETVGKVREVTGPIVEKIKVQESFMTRVKHLFFKPQPVLDSLKAKHTERKMVFTAYRERLQETQKLAPKSCGDLSKQVLTTANKNDLKDAGVLQNKVSQQLQQQCKLAGIDCKKTLLGMESPGGLYNEERVGVICNHLMMHDGHISPDELRDILQDAPGGAINLSDEAITKLARTLSKEALIYSKPDKLDSYAKDLANHVTKINTLLEHDRDTKLGATNEAVLKEIRAALNSPAYQALKECENNPCVRILHDLCVAGYLDAQVMDAYKEFNDKMLGHNPDSQINDPIEGKDLPQKTREYRTGVRKAGFFQKDMGNFFYMLANKTSTFQAALSQSSKPVLGMEYDPRMASENNAGAFFSEEAGLEGGKKATTTHFFTPSWRLGVDVPPEARAVLQSMTNRQHMEVEGGNDHNAQQICYNNAQDIRKGSEGASSANIMRLNDEYPDAFVGCTIPCDTSFHSRGLGHGSSMFDHLYEGHGNDGYNGPQGPQLMGTFKDSLFTELTKEENFQLEGRPKDGSGYYFHARDETEKAKWKTDLGKICEQLGHKYEAIQKSDGYRQIKEKIEAGGTALSQQDKEVWWHLESAMIEEANLMISTYNQSRGLQDLGTRVDGDLKQGMTSVCKELADRGKQRSLKQLYSCSPQDKDGKISPELATTFLTVTEGRPIIGARARMGLEHRNKTIEGLQMNRTPGELNESKTVAMQLILGDEARTKQGVTLKQT